MKIGYARVSTKKQNLDMQTAALKAAGCERVFVEKQSAFKERPELQHAFDMLRPGDTFYIWALDRLGRTMSEILQNVDILNKRNVFIKTVANDTDFAVDTASSSGKVVLCIFALIAKLENDLRKQRQREGILAARERGRIGGRPPGLSDEAKKKAPQAKLMYESKNPKFSVREICKRLNMSSRTFYKCLNYMGVKK